MKSIHVGIACLLGSAVGTGAALAHHHHLTADTAAGRAGDRVLIRAGYYPKEADVAIEDGRLLDDGDILVVDVAAQLTASGAFTGWYAGDELSLTSDFYFATGRLNGGNFMWELSSVIPVSGDSSELAWGTFADDGLVEPFTPLALSSANTRSGRSFDTAAGGHEDLQGMAFESLGLYDVTFVVWDSNGRYLDSDAVTVRFNVTPSPSSLGLMCLAGFSSVRRRRAPGM